MNFYDFLWLYLIIAVLWFFVGIIGTTCSDSYYGRRDAARFTCAAPIWPLALVYFIVTGLRNLIKLALDK